MKGMVDSAPPQVMGLRHLKTNLKKAELLGQRYDTIERDNRHLLTHMSSIGARRDYGAQRTHSLPLLRDPPGGPLRQREADRINQENALMLKRLQGMQAEYRTRDWEEQYRRSQDYVRLRCEYPPPLLPKARTPPARSSLTRLPLGKELNALAMGPSAVAAGAFDPGVGAGQDGEPLGPGAAVSEGPGAGEEAPAADRRFSAVDGTLPSLASCSGEEAPRGMEGLDRGSEAAGDFGACSLASEDEGPDGEEEQPSEGWVAEDFIAVDGGELLPS